MTRIFKNNPIIPNLMIIISCWIISFFNYTIMQIVGEYNIPLTVVPLFIAFSLSYKIPVFAIILIGLFDDFFLNAPLGVFPLIYCFSAYILLFSLKNIPSRKILISSFLILFFIANILLSI